MKKQFALTGIIFIFTLLILGCGKKIEENSSVEKYDKIDSTKTENVTETIVQDTASRIEEIKRMYEEVQLLSKNKSNIECKKGKKIAKETPFEDSEEQSYEQTASFCQVNEQYSIYTANFNGHEWLNEYSIYLKDGNIFFVLQSGGAEACSDESRAYYDKKGNLITLITKSNDCDGGDFKKSKTIKKEKELKRYLSSFNTTYNEIQKMINK